MNQDLNKLQPYPFERLAALKTEVTPPAELEHIALSIGEPKHPPPHFVLQNLRDNLPRIANYPSTAGMPELRQTLCTWLQKRFSLTPNTLTAEHNVLPVNGTREALFAFAQAVIDRQQKRPLVLSPNPFYQIYEGAAFLAGAELEFINCCIENNYAPDFDAVSEQSWEDCQLLYLCSPGNPTGAVLSGEQLRKLIALADKHDFIIASDECYSELYFDEQQAPSGLLQACAEIGRDDYSRCVVFHSLSKRSNLPGLRSGFVAGDADIIKQFLRYRTYHGCAMPISTQLASIEAWQDEKHVVANRDLYRSKFDRVLEILQPVMNVQKPEAGFYLWPKIQGCDMQFAQQLYAQQNITVLPGQFLAREHRGVNPGAGHIRMALVATVDECVQAAERIKRFVDA